MIDSMYEPYEYESLTVTNGSALPPSAAKLDKAGVGAADALKITVEGGQVRYREDAVDPTTTVGHLAHDLDKLYFFGPGAHKVKFIATGANVVLSITFYRRKR